MLHLCVSKPRALPKRPISSMLATVFAGNLATLLGCRAVVQLSVPLNGLRLRAPCLPSHPRRPSRSPFLHLAEVHESWQKVRPKWHRGFLSFYKEVCLTIHIGPEP